MNKELLESIKLALNTATDLFAELNLDPSDQSHAACYARKAHFDTIVAKDSINKALVK